jgi:hypothetical protein
MLPLGAVSRRRGRPFLVRRINLGIGAARVYYLADFQSLLIQSVTPDLFRHPPFRKHSDRFSIGTVDPGTSPG